MAMSLLALALAGCAAPKNAYQAPALSDDKLATIENYRDSILLGSAAIRLATVDGKVVTSGFEGITKIQPGRHWLQVVEQTGAFEDMNFTTCSLNLDLQAGHIYRFGKRYTSIPWSKQGVRVLYTGAIIGSDKSPGVKSNPMKMPVECVTGRTEMCRTNADCADGKICEHKDGFTYGLCGKTPR